MAKTSREIVVNFTRIGRTGATTLRIPFPPNESRKDLLSREVRKFVSQFLASRIYSVDFNLDYSSGWIEMGRFGEFTVTVRDTEV